MKIVSWNLNGLRANWEKGLGKFLETTKADIYAFQETKVSEPFKPVEVEGYLPYWSFCDSHKGYSGTLCLTRRKPVAVYYDFDIDAVMGSASSSATEAPAPAEDESANEAQSEEPFDVEGRVITLEFTNLYVVNVYVPNSQRSSERLDYRNRWNELFLNFVNHLQRKKPTIICGDFNVAISNDDIYPESYWVSRNEEGYLSREREDIQKLVKIGFADTYRMIHPDEREKYSWWSLRRKRRELNRGWRLDYIFASAMCWPMIDESTMLTNVEGSDHCPLLLEIDVPSAKLAKNRDAAHKEEIERISHTIDDGSLKHEFLHNENLGKLWDHLDWDKVEAEVTQRQYVLAKVAYSHDIKRILRKQREFVNSMAAKVMAVRHAASMKSPTAGCANDWKTSREKMAASLSLLNDEHVVKPANLVIIKCKNQRWRRIQVEEPFDRALQALYAMALDPVAESWADFTSFAFRRGRSSHDLNEFIKMAFMRNSCSPKYRRDRPSAWRESCNWAFIGDVHQCYERISHEWILEHIPLPKQVLKQFLKAGYV